MIVKGILTVTQLIRNTNAEEHGAEIIYDEIEFRMPWEWILQVALAILCVLACQGIARNWPKKKEEEKKKEPKPSKGTQTDAVHEAQRGRESLHRRPVWLARFGEVVHLDERCPGLDLARHGVSQRRLCSMCSL